MGPTGPLWIDAEDPDRAAIGPPVALDDLDRGRLARSVRPDQCEDLAGVDPERHAAQDRPAGVVFAQVGDLDCGSGSVGGVDGHPVGDGAAHPPEIATYFRSKSASVTGPIWKSR